MDASEQLPPADEGRRSSDQLGLEPERAEPTHTAGPWLLGADATTIVLGGSRYHANGAAIAVGSVRHGTRVSIGESIANGRLMAMAPELLAENMALRDENNLLRREVQSWKREARACGSVKAMQEGVDVR